MKYLFKTIVSSFVFLFSSFVYADYEFDVYTLEGSAWGMNGTHQIYGVNTLTGEKRLLVEKNFSSLGGDGIQDGIYSDIKTGNLVVNRTNGVSIYNPKTNAWTDITYDPSPLNAMGTNSNISKGPVLDSMIRKESNGDIHIGQNSVVIRDASLTSNNADTLFSSTGKLQLGDGPNHRTVVEGSLEIQDPKAPNQAATRRYVDSATALSMAMTTIPKSYNGKTVVGMGTGYFNGENAVAFGLSKNFIEKGMQVNVNIGHTSNAGTSGSAGVGLEF